MTTTEGSARQTHRVEWGQFGWACSCGAGQDWPLAPVSRARAAANRHLVAARRKERKG